MGVNSSLELVEGRDCLQRSDILVLSRISLKITVALVATPSRLIACYQCTNMEAAARISYRENLNSYLE